MTTNTIVKPDVDIDIRQEDSASIFEEHKVLMIGQMIPGSDAISGELIEDFKTGQDAQFGARSILKQMIVAFKKINTETRLDIIPMDDLGGATKAAGSLVFIGAATKNDIYDIAIGSKTTNRVKVTIFAGDTAAVVALKVSAAFASLPDSPVTIDTPVDGTSAFLAANGGKAGNFIGIDVFNIIQGLTVTINTFAGGTTSPDTSTILDQLEGVRYQTIICSDKLTIGFLTPFLDDRFNIDNTLLDGIGIATIQDPVPALASYGNSIDSLSMVLIANPLNTAANHGLIFELPEVMSSEFGASRALRFTTGSNITKLLSGSNRGDTVGGPHMASRPYQNIPFPELSLIDSLEGLTKDEITTLENAGLSFLGNNIARDQIVMSTARTTDKTDPTWEFLNTVDTASNVREYFFNNLVDEYSQTRLTKGDLIADVAMQNENSIRTFVNKLYSDLSTQSFNLTVAGEEALNIFKKNTIINLDSKSGRFAVSFNNVPIVQQVRSIDTVVNIQFVVTG